MDLAAARQKVVAANIANAATPGYKAKDIDFAGEMQRSIDQTAGPNGIGLKPTPAVSEVAGLATGNDGNNVNLDRESQLLMENALRFNAATQLWKSQLQQIKTAIQAGRTGS